MIALLNGSYVPVFLSNEDYAETGSASREEKAELRRIHTEGYAKKLSVGSVHAFILAPGGSLIDSMHTAEAAIPEKLIAMLDRNVKSLGVRPGDPVVKPAPPAPPACGSGDVRFYLTARYLNRSGDDYTLVENAGGNWSALPSEDWIFISKEAWRRAIPSRGLAIGGAFAVDPQVRDALFIHFYPPTENWDLSTNRIDSATLKATIEPAPTGILRLRLDGSLHMKHSFYHKDDDRFVETTIIGYADIDAATHHVRSLNLVTDRAEYGSISGGGLSFGVALKMSP